MASAEAVYSDSSQDSSPDHNMDSSDSDEVVEVVDKAATVQKPNSPLQMFCYHNSAKYKKQHPKMSLKELNRLMAKDFSNLSDKKQKIYSAMAEKANSKSPTKVDRAETSRSKAAEDKSSASSAQTKRSKAETKAASSLASKSSPKPASNTTNKAPTSPKAPENGSALYKNEPAKPPT